MKRTETRGVLCSQSSHRSSQDSDSTISDVIETFQLVNVGFEADSVARYNSLVDRIKILESDKVDFHVRRHEAKLRGLQQTLLSYQGTLHELEQLRSERQNQTAKAIETFDILGKRHKDRRVDACRQRELDALENLNRHANKMRQLTQETKDQREIVISWKRKAKELDYVRQCEVDLVDCVFGGQDTDNKQHEVLEQAVCALAPRVNALRDSSAHFAIMVSRCEGAARELKHAVDRLQGDFKIVQEDQRQAMEENNLGHEDLAGSDQRSRKAAISQALGHIKSSIFNLETIHSKAAVPNFCAEVLQSLNSVMEWLDMPAASLASPEADRQVNRAIATLLAKVVDITQAGTELDQLGKAKIREMQEIERLMMDYKERLDNHRRDILKEKVPLLQSMVRANSMLTDAEKKKKFRPYTEREFEIFAERHRASSSSNLSSLADLSTSASSELYRVGSLPL